MISRPEALLNSRVKNEITQKTRNGYTEYAAVYNNSYMISTKESAATRRPFLPAGRYHYCARRIFAKSLKAHNSEAGTRHYPVVT
jgi:hypothetical protein